MSAIDSAYEKYKKHLIYLASFNEFEIEGKIYKYRPLSTKQFIDLEKAREKLLDRTSSSIDTVIEVYSKGAEYYLGISKDIFMNLKNYEEVKTIVDACIYKTSYSSI